MRGGEPAYCSSPAETSRTTARYDGGIRKEIPTMDANIAVPAALIADPARSAILLALMDGRAHPAGTLAYAANLSPQAASNHLAKLLDGGMVLVEIEGRHRYYRLARPEVATVLEALLSVAP